MKDCGAHVPFIASWKGTGPAGKVLKDLVDFTDLSATFADLAGARRPADVTFDGRSFAPQLRGRPGQPREWIFVQLGAKWYVREMDWKLNNDGELFDMKDAPFEEKLVAADAQDAAAAAARKRLQAVLDKLNPAGGKTDPDGGPNKTPKKGKKKAAVTTT
jgi:arylsulfatase A-like enzyme